MSRTALSDDVWSKILTLLREELPARTVKNWFETAEVEALQGSSPPTLLLNVPSSYHRKHIRQKYHSALASASKQVLQQKVGFEFQVSDGPREASPERTDAVSGSASTDETLTTTERADREQAHENRRRIPEQRAPQTSGGGKPVPAITKEASKARGRSAEQATISQSARDEFHYSRIKSQLKGRYTFDRFVEGDSNELARSASFAVAQRPGETNYNPLLIYGGVGLGKTHLAQAIANYAATKETAEYVCYVSGEKFTNEFVQAIQRGNGSQFSKKYRGVDLLILDDVQFFQGKEKTQEEFFHLFNDLHQKNKQIVLCADRPPQEIGGMEERLLSRFQWGLNADIQRPHFETRLAILHLKVETLGLAVEQEVLDFMAKRITGNVRQLEGAIKQLSARASLLESKIDLSTAQQILDNQVENLRSTDPTPEHILKAVTNVYDVSREDLLGRSRRQELVHPRHVAMYFCRELTSLSLSDIGSRFAGRDHSTVSHACQKISDLLDVEPELEEELTRVKRKVQKRALRT